jgi:3-hydroxy-9,10-secoandrosta-1,3,5(10)-triene-9,17-dione monooxygenase
MTNLTQNHILISTDADGRRSLTHPEAATITPEDLVARATAMIPTLRDRAAATEAARRILPETLDDFLHAGFFRIVQPKRFGGFEMGMDVLQRVLVEIGRGCPSSAWTLGILTGHAWWAAQFPEAGQVEIYGDEGVALLPTGIFGRGGMAKRVDGGYQLRGEWHYQSGIDAANWLGCGAMLETAEGEPPAQMSFIVPRAEGRLMDDWFVMGMKGTGSKSVIVEDVFVPDSRAVTLASVEAQETPGSKLHTNPLYRTHLMAFISIEVTGAAVGAAQGAVDVLEELGRTKPVRARGGGGGETAQFEMSRPGFRRRLAEAKTLADAAKTMLIAESERLMRLSRDQATTGEKMTREQIAEVTLHQSRIIQMSVQAVKHAFIAAGTSATVQGHPMERFLRDVNVIATHQVLRLDTAAEAWGLAHYGL